MWHWYNGAWPHNEIICCFGSFLELLYSGLFACLLVSRNNVLSTLIPRPYPRLVKIVLLGFAGLVSSCAF